MPNKLYSKGMMQTDFWDSIIGRFGKTDNVSQKDFFSDKFALWIDLRSYPDNSIHGNGLHLSSTKDGVKIEMKRTSAGSINVTCYMFVIGDGLLEFENNDLKAIMY